MCVSQMCKSIQILPSQIQYPIPERKCANPFFNPYIPIHIRRQNCIVRLFVYSSSSKISCPGYDEGQINRTYVHIANGNTTHGCGLRPRRETKGKVEEGVRGWDVGDVVVGSRSRSDQLQSHLEISCGGVAAFA